LIEEEKERARLEVLEANRQEAARTLKVKQAKFKAHKSLVLARLSGSTWVKKDGKSIYYDSIDWQDAVMTARDKVKGLLGEEEDAIENNETSGNNENNEIDESNENNIDEMKIESLHAESSIATSASGGPEPKGPRSEWIEVEVNGQKMLQNFITQEFKPV
jgi:hypothetical protein